MLIDLRTYTLRVGTVRDFLAQYAREGLEVQRRHLVERSPIASVKRLGSAEEQGAGNLSMAVTSRRLATS